jgi:Pup amidohydrolase
VATPKYVGIETEYGITVDGPVELNAVLASSLVVNAYRAADVRWDHTDEQPLRDARGFDARPAPDAPADTDARPREHRADQRCALLRRPRASRVRQPEVSNALDAVIWDRGRRTHPRDGRSSAEAGLPAGCRVLIHKNNTDGKGAAYGTHENYLVPRSIPFGHLTDMLLPFFATRLVYVGAGRIGSELDTDVDLPALPARRLLRGGGRARDHPQAPLMNTRDEPHADPDRYRRLHVINGDANLCEVATFLKVGTMLLLLDAIEDGALGTPVALATRSARSTSVSHDLSLRATIEREDGSRITAIEVQWEYLDACRRYVKERERDRPRSSRGARALGGRACDRGARPRPARRSVDWATKLELLDGYARATVWTGPTTG